MLPGAQVTVRSAETGFTRVATTSGAGVYTVADVPAGRYVITVHLEGYKEAVVSEVVLNVADVRTIDVRLEVGAVAEEITIVADPIAVETIGGEVAGLVTGEQVRELPLNGRNFTQLTLLMPGVAAPDGFDTKNKGLLTGSDLSVSGGAVTANLWTVDGANNNDVGSNRTILVYPSIDAIEEFKIHRNSYGAEFGGASGAQINLITRSGTNDYNGNVFYFMRDDAWNEKNYFLEQADQDKEKLSRQDFGYTFGGPLVRDKLHFFVSQEWNDEERGVVKTGFVPSDAERAGDFSGARSPCAPPLPVDPLTGQPFPGNRIPADRLSPAGQALLNLYPRPNTSISGGCINWVDSVNTPIDFQQENLRFDWSVTDSTRLMVRYTQDAWENGAPNAGEANGLWGDDPFPAVDSTWDQEGFSMVAQLNQTIGSAAVNNLQFSYSGNEIVITRGGLNDDLNSQINSLVPAIFPGKTGGGDRSHPVFWGAQGYAALWNIAPWENQQDLYVLKDDYQRVFGKHWVRVGALYSDNKKSELIGGASAFESPQFWGAAGINGWGATSGNVLADFLLKDMTHGFSEVSTEPNVELEWNDAEIYVADTWQMLPHLSLDLGLRYSRLFAPESANGRVASFNPALYDPALGADPCNGLMLPPGSTACRDAGFRGGAAGPNGSLVAEDDDDIAPRLGFAWDLRGDGRSALRGGFGQFYQRDRVGVALEFGGNPPFVSSQSGIRKLDDAAEPCGGCFALSGGVPRVGYDTGRETPYTNQWNLTYEQRLWRNSTVELSYVGSRGVHLMRRVDINQVPAGDGNGNGVADRLEYIRLGDDNAAQGLLRPFSALGDVNVLFWRNDGQSEYTSFQGQFTSRFGRGSHFQASYTWSDLDANDPLNDSGAGAFRGQITDLGNLGLDWGPAGIHREHIFNSSLILHLPFFEDEPGLKGALLGGWSIGTIVSYASGLPLTVYAGAIPGVAGGVSGTGYVDNQRPNRVGGVLRAFRARGLRPRWTGAAGEAGAAAARRRAAGPCRRRLAGAARLARRGRRPCARDAGLRRSGLADRHRPRHGARELARGRRPAGPQLRRPPAHDLGLLLPRRLLVPQRVHAAAARARAAVVAPLRRRQLEGRRLPERRAARQDRGRLHPRPLRRHRPPAPRCRQRPRRAHSQERLAGQRQGEDLRAPGQERRRPRGRQPDLPRLDRLGLDPHDPRQEHRHLERRLPDRDRAGDARRPVRRDDAAAAEDVERRGGDRGDAPPPPRRSSR